MSKKADDTHPNRSSQNCVKLKFCNLKMNCLSGDWTAQSNPKVSEKGL